MGGHHGVLAPSIDLRSRTGQDRGWRTCRRRLPIGARQDHDQDSLVQSSKRRTKSASSSCASFSILHLTSPMITSGKSWESAMTFMISSHNVVKSSLHLLLCAHLEDFQPVDMTFALTTARFVTRSQRRLQTMYGSAIMFPSSRMWSASSKKVCDLEDTEEGEHKCSSTLLCHGTSDIGRSWEDNWHT